MGYGGEVKNSGFITKLSNDGGIDGIIKEDILGFNHISIQAKRYALGNNVGRNEVQSFVLLPELHLKRVFLSLLLISQKEQ